MIGKYIGSDKIKNVVVKEGDLTPRGSHVLEVTFENDTKKLVAAPLMDYIISDEVLDPSALRDRHVQVICAEILEIFGEFDLRVSDFDHVTQVLKMSLEDQFEKAETALWKTDRKTWLDMYRVLRDNGKLPDQQ